MIITKKKLTLIALLTGAALQGACGPGPDGSLQLESIAPATGSIYGGTIVTLTGQNFAAGMTATVGPNNCTPLTVVSATQATCTTVPHEAGAVDVTVTSKDGTETSALPGAFTYA